MNPQIFVVCKYIYDHLVVISHFHYSMPIAYCGAITGIFISKIYLLEKYIDVLLKFVVKMSFLLASVVAIGYLFYPSYLDHLESTIATLGVIFFNGGQIYPILTDHSLHGLLYGPALTEIQSTFGLLGLPTILSSKIPGVLALIISIALLFSILKNNFSKAYLIFLIPFGLYLFWNRSDPFFLLLVALSLYISSYSNSIVAVFLIGCFAGLSASLKLHAATYIVAVMAVTLNYKDFNLQKFLVFLLGIAITLTIAYSPKQISIINFVTYIELASKHGLSIKQLLINLFYLLGLSAPVIYLVIYKIAIKRKYLVPVALLMLMEIFIAVIGSKPGSGEWHLLPFIPINAFLLERIFMDIAPPKPAMIPFKFGLLAVGVAGTLSLSSVVLNMITQYHFQRALRIDVDTIAVDYPGVILGVSDNSNYSHIFFRPLLEAKGFHQIDYPTYMDLNFSGMSDDSLSNAIKNCKFPYIALPKKGESFSMNNSYTDKVLFSNNVRNAFNEKYTIASQNDNYIIYECKK